MLRFLDIALGSAMELKRHILRARGFRVVDAEPARTVLADLDLVQQMIASLRRTIRRRVRASGGRHHFPSHLEPST